MIIDEGSRSPEELICPTCDERLFRTVSGRIGLLECSNGHGWTEQDRVAVLTPEDLLPQVRETVDSFAYKWKFAPEAVREERIRVANHWFYDRFGLLPDGEARLAQALQGKRCILDAGCGMGNLTCLLARLAPEATVWGIDLSPVVHAVAKHQPPPNVRLVQGDLLRLPIAGEFDFIVSDGVLHHTENTRTAFLSLAKRLAPGGELLVYVYKRKAPVREFTDDHLRRHTTGMAPEECMEFAKALTDLGRQLREAHVTVKVDKALPLLGIPAGTYDLHRFFYWYFLKCFWDDGGNVEASVVENFDWYHPTIARRHDPEEIRSWHKTAGLEIVRFDVADSGISSWGRRPV